MTDVTTETVGPDTEAEGWGEDSPAYPEFPGNPHNHRFTVSMNGQGPMVVVRGNTAEEVNAAWQELEEHATGAIMGNAWAALKAAAALANGLGASPVPAGAPVAPQTPGVPTPPPFGPNVSVPAAPGFQGNQGFAPPPAAPAGPQNAEYKNAGWYRLDVPFPKKGQFDGIVAQYQLRKGRPSEGGSYSFNSKGEKAWYVSPEVAGAFPMFSPMPA